MPDGETLTALPWWQRKLNRWAVYVIWPDGGEQTLGFTLTRRSARAHVGAIQGYCNMLNQGAYRLEARRV